MRDLSENKGFTDFQNTEAATRSVLCKKVSYKFHTIHKKTPLPGSLFDKTAGLLQLYLKRDSGTGAFL